MSIKALFLVKESQKCPVFEFPSSHPFGFDFILFVIVALILVLIMTPLTVISVKKIRKKFKGKTLTETR